MDIEFQVQGSGKGLGVWGLGVGFRGLGGLGFGGLGFRGLGLGFRVWALGV